MRDIYRLEIMVAIIGVFMIAMSLLPPPSLTGYVTGLNTTFYMQELGLTIDSSNSYTLTTLDGDLHLSSFMLSGEVFGDGRVEILLDNGKGQQYLIYENVKRQKEFKTRNLITGISAGITGKAVSGTIEDEYTSNESETDVNEAKEGTEKIGTFLAITPKKLLHYEFTPLNKGDEILKGLFYSECTETCEIPRFMFYSDSYELIFRLESGTSIRIDELKYTLYE